MRPTFNPIIVNNKSYGYFAAKEIPITLGILLLLQISAGLMLIIFHYKDGFISNIKSLGLVIILLVLQWYLLLIPFLILLVLVFKILDKIRLPQYSFIIIAIILYLIYFTLVYGGNFWQLHCYRYCNFSQWFDSERKDLFFNFFTLLALVYFTFKILKFRTGGQTEIPIS